VRPVRILGALALGLAAAGALAQGYPSKPIRVVVPNPPAVSTTSSPAPSGRK